jgi:hypothetical protein
MVLAPQQTHDIAYREARRTLMLSPILLAAIPFPDLIIYTSAQEISQMQLDEFTENHTAEGLTFKQMEAIVFYRF